MLVVQGLKVIRGSFKVTLNDCYIDDGECVALCGVSGSGKSTLLEALGLLTPAFAVQRFILDNIEVDELPQAQAQALRVSAIGIMPQVGGLIPYLTVRENVRLQIQLALKQQVRAQSPTIQEKFKSDPMAQKVASWVKQVNDVSLPYDNCDGPGSYRNSIFQGTNQLLPSYLLHRINGERLARHLEVLDESSHNMMQSYIKALRPYSERLQLEGILDKFPHQLSIGQRQRALFLRAIAHKPRLLLIDEPTSALDPDNAQTLFELIDEIAHVSRMSILVVTHDLKASERYRRYMYDREHSHGEHSVFIPEPVVDSVESADLASQVLPTSGRLTKSVFRHAQAQMIEANSQKENDSDQPPSASEIRAATPELSAQAAIAAYGAELHVGSTAATATAEAGLNGTQHKSTDFSEVSAQANALTRWGEVEALGEILVDVPAAAHIMDESYTKVSTRKAAGSSALSWLRWQKPKPSDLSPDELLAQQALEQAQSWLPFGFSYYTSAPDKLRMLKGMERSAHKGEAEAKGDAGSKGEVGSKDDARGAPPEDPLAAYLESARAAARARDAKSQSESKVRHPQRARPQHDPLPPLLISPDLIVDLKPEGQDAD